MLMSLHVDGAARLGDHRAHLSFDDGTSAELDLSGASVGSVFEPLRDVAYFRRFELVGRTLAWNNGADFAPEFLRQLAETQGTLLDEAS